MNIEDGWVGLALLKSQVCERVVYDLVPFVSGLFKSIDWLVQLDTIFLQVGFFIARQLLHEYFFIVIKFPIKESIVEVEHVNWPIIVSSDSSIVQMEATLATSAKVS
jgi:hypothetical protein